MSALLLMHLPPDPCRGVVGAASGAGIAIGAYFAFYGAATNLLVKHTELKRGQVAFVAGAAAAAGGSVVKVPLAVCIRCDPRSRWGRAQVHSSGLLPPRLRSRYCV